VAVPVGWEDEMEEETGGTTDALGPNSGLSEKWRGGRKIPSDRERREIIPPTVRELLEFQVPSAWDIWSACNEDER
jgi:hypothetical protein